MHDLVLPTLLFAALGGMSWAIRGSVGYGGLPGCVYAGVIWGIAWWFIAREPSGRATRRYASGWIVLALTVGMGIAGARGWRQWSTFFVGQLQTNTARGEYIPISPAYGFIWLFIAGVPWAGLGACMVAWCGSGPPTRAWQWGLRLACGFGMAFAGSYLLQHHREYFLPLYKSIESQYNDLAANPNLQRLINDNRNAITHLGYYLGFLMFEVGRRDWKNVLLILTVGIVSGLGWCVCQCFWMVAPSLWWPRADPIWWRCWETCGGISIGLAYGLAYFLVNRPLKEEEERCRRVTSRPNLEWLLIFLGLLASFCFFFPDFTRDWAGWLTIGFVAFFAIATHMRHRARSERLLLLQEPPPSNNDPNTEQMGVYLGLLLGLGISIKHGLVGLLKIYPTLLPGGGPFWTEVVGRVFSPAMFVCSVALTIWGLRRPQPRGFQGDMLPHAFGLIWLVLIVQYVLAVMVTGPFTQWHQVMYNIYYFMLFLLSAVIIWHYQFLKTRT